MLTVQDRQIVWLVLKHWPKRRAHLFMRGLLNGGRMVTTERQAILILKKDPTAIRFAGPEVAVAFRRKELTYAGIERAFRELTAFCRDRDYLYLELLENNPDFLRELLEGDDRFDA